MLQVYGYCVPIFGKRVVFDVHSKVRQEQLKLLADALRAEKIKSYAPQVVMEVEVSLGRSVARK